MPKGRKSPYEIILSDQEHQELEAVARRYSSPYRDVMRAKIVLYAGRGLSNQEIADRLDVPRQVVSKWRKRFFEEHLDGLQERSRRGRPRFFPPQVAIEVKATARELPARLGPPLSRLFVPDIQREVIKRGIVAEISGKTIWRWLGGRHPPVDLSQLDLPAGPGLRGQGRQGARPLREAVEWEALGRRGLRGVG